MRKNIRHIIIISIGAFSWILFWYFYGHNLSFNVEAGSPGDMTHWYTEEFSFIGKIIITTLVSLLTAIIVWFCIPKKQSKL
jgi:hypothetical protein